MKLIDILYEARGTFVIKSGRGDYRVDPNWQTTSNDDPKSWSKNVADAHVFDERAARRFIRKRAEVSQRGMSSPYDHRNIGIVPVNVVDGKPELVQPIKKRRFSFGKKKSG